jgi:hypothetical protein
VVGLNLPRPAPGRDRGGLNTDQPITQIGQTVGWADQNYFARRFKAHYGLSATIYLARSPTTPEPVGTSAAKARDSVNSVTCDGDSFAFPPEWGEARSNAR